MITSFTLGGFIHAIHDAESILLMGPGEAKGELKKRLSENNFGERIATFATVDKMTVPQIAAKVRAYFHNRIQGKETGKTIMKIQINTGHNISGREEMVRRTEAVVESTLSRLAEYITRVEVHLSDENGKKGGGHDKRCLMEARLRGHQPIAVSTEAETIDQAISGAAGKLKSSLDHTIGRLSGHERRKHKNIKTSNAFTDTPLEI